MPLVPCTGIFLGPSKSGKTVALISMILEQYRGVFEKIYIFSPSINIDDSWVPVKKYIEEDLGVNTEREQAYYDEWDEAALRGIIQRQRKITETSKKLEMKKLYQVLSILDDYADSPQLHKAHGALDTLFIRGRHMQISTWVSSQKLRLISAAVRVNMQFLCCAASLSALLPKDKLHRIYEQASGALQLPLRLLPQAKESNVPLALRRAFCTGKRSRWERRSASWARNCSLALRSSMRGARTSPAPQARSAAVQPPIVRRTGGFLKKRMTTIYVDSRKRVAGSDSDFEVDLGESLHLQSDARLAVYKIRIADSFLSTDRGHYLYWVDAALGTLNWALLPEGAYTGSRLAAWISSNFATATYSETTNSLSVAYDGNRSPSERSGAAAAVPSRCGLPHLAGRLAIQALQHRPHARPELRLWRAAGLRIREDDGIQRGLPALPPAGQRQPRAGQSGGRHPVQDNAEERRGHHCGDRLR